MKPGSLVVGYLHGGEVAHSFHESMEAHFVYDAMHSQRLVGKIREQCGAGRIIDGRNDVGRKFLNLDAEWLGFVDADMGWEADAWDRLIEAADPKERPIVGGLAFSQRNGPQGPAASRHLQHLPTVYRWIETPTTAGVSPILDYPEDQLVECDATGGAFFIVHRSVLEKLTEVFPEPRPWFDDTVYKGQVFGEDITFFRRCAENGFPVYVHTGVKTSHRKSTYLTEQTVSYAAPTYVVIPVKDRLDLTSSLLRQLKAQGGYEAIFVYDNGSGKKTKNWLSTQDIAEVFDAEGQNIHQMWNRGIEEALSRAWPVNIAILNNDLKIGPDFLHGLADAIRSDARWGAVSPNYDGRPGEGVQEVHDISAGRYDGTGGLAGFAFMLKGESGYRFPEQLNWWYGDNDLLASILTAGSKAGIVLDTTVEHVDGGSQTGSWDDPEIQPLLQADREWFQAKWSSPKQ